MNLRRCHGLRAVLLSTLLVFATLLPASAQNAESWDDLSVDALNSGTAQLPLNGGEEGPTVLRVQLLLDRAGFSPGIMDGYWGKNTKMAVTWFQKRYGLDVTGAVDSTTYAQLLEVGGTPDPWIRTYSLTSDDVDGPFVDIPEDIYEKAKLDRMAYESLTELLSEKFHVTPDLLSRLNPDTALDSLGEGDTIHVPHLNDQGSDSGASIARLVISGKDHYVHAVDSAGTVIYHFPTTLGSSYDPSPSGEFEIESITEEPWWHYQPDILAGVPDSEEDARIPPGPNNAVGMVWMALSKDNYGIHGTSAPETIGYAQSAGCVRLTNWDALFLARRIEAGTPVDFVEVDARSDDGS